MNPFDAVERLHDLRTVEMIAPAIANPDAWTQWSAATDALNELVRELIDNRTLIACFEDQRLRERCSRYW